MESKRGVCLISFDDIKGPDCVYSEGLDNNFAEKVSMKSHLSTLSLTSGDKKVIKEEFVESIIPFLDEGYVAYSTFFFIDDSTARGGKRTVGIVTLVDRSEQMALYKLIPEISLTVRNIANELFKSKMPLDNISDNIKDSLNSLLNIEELKVDFPKQDESTELIKKRFENQPLEKQTVEIANRPNHSLIEGSFEFLIDKLPMCLDRIIHALLKNERILVIGRQDEIVLTLATLREFLPHKKLYSDIWTVPLLDAEALFSKTAEKTTLHVLGIRDDSFYDVMDIGNGDIYEREPLAFCEDDLENNIKNLPVGSKVIIDFNQGQVIGGISNHFCSNLLLSIEHQSFDDARILIEKQITYLLERISQLIDMFIYDLPDKMDLELFVDNSSAGEISLMVSIIEDTNPKLLEKILFTFAMYRISLEILF
ncbi:MAG: hypothetical protein ACTSP7_03355 [Candidatus Heimdallarchaeota archaeon]